MGEHIRKYFYWPSITAVSIKHVKSCLVCLKKDKANPKPMTMQEREMVTVGAGSSRYCGTFPYFQAGFQILPDLPGHGNQVSGSNPPSEDDYLNPD